MEESFLVRPNLSEILPMTRLYIGDKSNHIPSFHVPQGYYFIGFSTVFGWPVFLTYPGGIAALLGAIKYRMVGSVR
jgi:alpha-1,2-glucosyltransferase